MYLVDADGKRYLDFGSGIAVSALGHSHPRLMSVLRNQGEKLLHLSNLYITQPQIDLAGMLVKHSFGAKVFLCNSGTEAMEAAIKFSQEMGVENRTRQIPHPVVLRRVPRQDLRRAFRHRPAAVSRRVRPSARRLPLCGAQRRRRNKAVLDKDNFSTIIVEPIQGEGGVNIASQEFFAFLRDYATGHGIALVFDEIQCGMGRTGKLWCYEHHGVVPDILTAAKPLGGGLPLGAVICNEQIALAISPGNHGTTFGGNPLACALGCELLTIVSKPRFSKR